MCDRTDCLLLAVSLGGNMANKQTFLSLTHSHTNIKKILVNSTIKIKTKKKKSQGVLKLQHCCVDRSDLLSLQYVLS